MSYQVNDKVARLNEIIEHIGNVWLHFYETYINSFIDPEILKQLEIRVNPYVLSAAIEHARVDLSRWLDLHLSECPQSMPDNHKYAGFLAKWVAKLRPVMIIVPESFDLTYSRELYEINALFAVFVFRSYLKRDISKKLAKELIYRLHLRDETGENLAFFAYVCENIHTPDNSEKA